MMATEKGYTKATEKGYMMDRDKGYVMDRDKGNMNERILDIHRHLKAGEEGILHPEAVIGICVGRDRFEPVEQQLYSAGIHPWHIGTEDVTDSLWSELEEIAARPDVVAIGECGVDLGPQYGPLYKQLLLFKRHVELSERLRKPIVIHDVKAHDIIAGARRDMKPSQAWAIHGFRRNAATAQMLLRAGCYISFGPEFNEEAVRTVPYDRILAETDDSDVDIKTVVARISAARGEEMEEKLRENAAHFLTGIDD